MTVEQQQALALARARRRRAEQEQKEEVPAQEEPQLSKAQQVGKSVIGTIRPTVEALGAVGGGVLGTPIAPPFGTVGGAGLGYGIARGGLNLIEELIGTRTPPASIPEGFREAATDVALGATGEAVGRAAAPHLARGVGYVADIASGKMANVKAGRIAREALGPDLSTARNILSSAPDSLTAGQATAGINSPAWQSLNQRVSKIDPRFYGGGQTPEQLAKADNILSRLAGGETQTAMRTAQGQEVNALNKRLIPVLETELNAANTAGVMKPKLEGQANRFAEAASSKVEDVRRFTAAGERAGHRAATTVKVPGQPRVPGRYTYMGELEKSAEKVAEQAANASLPFGEASRFAQAAADSLAAHGLKPLESKAVLDSIMKTSAKPEFAGNRDVAKAMSRVAEDVANWTKEGGVIDAYALDAIRKNSVNGVIRELYPAADKSTQKELAASVLTKVKPIVVEAIEKAGGTGYGKYLSDYSTGRHAIDQMKMSSVAQDLFRNSPKAFVELVEGNSPKEVEKIFGAGKFDLAKEMSPQAMSQLRQIAGTTKRSIRAAEQAELGQQALKTIIEKNTLALKIPWGLSPKTMAMNKALDVAERKLGAKTMNILAEGLKTGAKADELLNYLPTRERVNAFRVLSDPSLFPPGLGAATAGLVQE